MIITLKLRCSRLIAFTLDGVMGRQWIKDVVNQTVGQANVNGTKLASFAFPLPPKDEQAIIVEYAEDQTSVIDHLEADVEGKMGSADSLRQSILRHAFSGQLAPQNPSDEPVSELLKRIAAEREDGSKARASQRMRATKRQKREK
jgi:type I restriction enzyme S subunit